jgi:anti-sigma regulatory factor (Ser/Thr protein kinase)
VATSQCRSESGTATSAWPVPTLERTYPGQLEQGQQVRAALRSFLAACPVADEVITVAWELAANACLYSNSRKPGGQFGMTIHDFTSDYVYAEVRDQGGTWDANLSQAAESPHGLYLMQQIATTYGAAGGRRGWIIWFTVNYPTATPVPALPSRQVPVRPAGWCPPQRAAISPETLRRVRAALDRL